MGFFTAGILQGSYGRDFHGRDFHGISTAGTLTAGDFTGFLRPGFSRVSGRPQRTAVAVQAPLTR